LNAETEHAEETRDRSREAGLSDGNGRRTQTLRPDGALCPAGALRRSRRGWSQL